jgi:RHS repeat-associated protein
MIFAAGCDPERGGNDDGSERGGDAGVVPFTYEPPMHAPAEPHPYDGCEHGSCDRTEPGLLSTGTYDHKQMDLFVQGRGFDFVWERRYRSRGAEAGSGQGHGWDYSYNVWAEVVEDGIVIHDGNNRPQLFEPDGSGRFVAAGYHRVARIVEGRLLVDFADGGRWSFRAFDEPRAPGRIARIADRNANQMTFSYDAAGQLTRIRDTLGRAYRVAWNDDGTISSVSDFDGRIVRYEYDSEGEAGGGVGDLAAAFLPPIVGSETGNDFPEGRRLAYTYTHGTGDPDLDHNLLTATDAVGVTYLQNEYASTTDASALEYDRLVRQRLGGPEDWMAIHYRTEDWDGEIVVLATLNDRVGNVSEHAFDGRNLRVRLREFTGRAAPGSPVSGAAFAPAAPALRPTDPTFYETRWTYNADLHATRIEHPRGNVTEYAYEGDGSLGVDPRRRANIVARTDRGGTAINAADPDDACIDQVRTWTYQYRPRLGNDHAGVEYAVRVTDPTGVVVRAAYDARGNQTARFQADGTQRHDYEFNEFGQPTLHVTPPDSQGVRQRNATLYAETGPGRGYVSARIVDVGGLELTTQYIVDGRGNPTTEIDPRGNATTRVFNAADEVVVERSPAVDGVQRADRRFYDANMRMTMLSYDNVDAFGVVDPSNPTIDEIYEYDELGEEVGQRLEIEPGVERRIEMRYDANRDPIEVRNLGVLGGENGMLEVERMEWDERRLLHREILAPGTGAQLVTTHRYDLNGDLEARVVDALGAPRETVTERDCWSRDIQTRDPMGNERRVELDDADRVLSVGRYGERVDEPGTAGNELLSQVEMSYDVYGRLIGEAELQFDEFGAPIGDGLNSTTFVLDQRGRPTQTIDDRGAVRARFWDTAGRSVGRDDPTGNRWEQTLDAAGNAVGEREVLASGLAADVILDESATYDEVDDRVASVDLAGRARRHEMDSRGNTEYDEDARRGLDPSGPGNRILRTHDGRNQLLASRYLMTSTGSGDGAVIGELLERTEFDGQGRAVRRIDPNGQVTEHVFDAQGREVVVSSPGGVVHTMTYDAVGNVIEQEDANGTRLTMRYDLNDRLVEVLVAPGAGVAQSTTFERFSYDGLGRMVLAIDDDITVSRTYDSLGYMTSETISGETAGDPWTHTVRFVHDALGGRLQTTYPSGRQIDQTLDIVGRVVQTREDGELLATHVWQGNQRIARRTYPSIAAVSDFGFDGEHRRLSLAHRLDGEDLDVRTLRRDEEGQTIFEQEQVVGSVKSVGYDSVGRTARSTVVGSIAVDRETDYTYDPAGNWLAVSDGACAGTRSVEPGANRYLSTGCERWTYSGEGELVRTQRTAADGRWLRIRYDHRGRVERAIALAGPFDPEGGIVLRVQYDALGRPIQTFRGGAPWQVRSYDDLDVVEETDSRVGATWTYVYGPSDVPARRQLLQRQDEDSGARDVSAVWYFEDDSGSTVAAVAVGDDGVQIERYEYDEYGRSRAIDEGGQVSIFGALSNPWRFHGMREYPELGVLDGRARWLDSISGRYWQPDPIGAWGDPTALGNPYVFAGQQPTTGSDATGLAKTPKRVGHFTEMERQELKDSLNDAHDWSWSLRKQIEWVTEKKKKRWKGRWYDSNRDLLRNYFGVYEKAKRIWWLRNNIRDVHQRLKNDVIRFRHRSNVGLCESPTTAAWTYKNNKSSSIWLCRPNFFNQRTLGEWAANMKGIASSTQPNVLLHEVSHNVGDVRDHQYGYGDSVDLATLTPRKAKHNADNFGFASQTCGGRAEGVGCP